MDFGSLGEDLPVLAVFMVLATGACLGASATLYADWAVLTFFLDAVTWSCLGTSMTGLGVG